MRSRTVVKSLVVLAAAAFTLSLTACNAVSGLGRDLEEASENTSEAVDKAIND
jgi:predicted small secreted protein